MTVPITFAIGLGVGIVIGLAYGLLMVALLRRKIKGLMD